MFAIFIVLDYCGIFGEKKHIQKIYKKYFFEENNEADFIMIYNTYVNHLRQSQYICRDVHVGYFVKFGRNRAKT